MQGTVVDVVSRHFAPWVGIDEDPVTGAHVVLVPYWIRERYFQDHTSSSNSVGSEATERAVKELDEK